MHVPDGAVENEPQSIIAGSNLYIHANFSLPYTSCQSRF